MEGMARKERTERLAEPRSEFEADGTCQEALEHPSAEGMWAGRALRHFTDVRGLQDVVQGVQECVLSPSPSTHTQFQDLDFGFQYFFSSFETNQV